MMKNLSKFILIIPVLAALLPIPSFAARCQTVANIDSIGDIICKIGDLLSLIIPVLILLGVVYFVWGVVMYVIGDDEEAKKKGKDRIIFGILGFVVIFALWGLVSIVIYTFGVEQQGGTLVQNFIEYNKSFVVSDTGGCNIAKGFTGSTLGHLINYATCVITSSIVPLILALAMLMFIWGVVQYVINTDDEAKKSKGRDFMIWGIIGLTVMIGVWGLVRILGGTFGIDYAIPQVH